MKLYRLISFITTLVIANMLCAQSTNVERIEQLLELEEYETIINEYSNTGKELSDTCLYYIGIAHYANGDSYKALNYMDSVIIKDSTSVSSFYIKACIYTELGMKSKAVDMIHKAKNNLDEKSENYISYLYDILVV